MENKKDVIDMKVSINKESFIAALNEVNTFLASSKVVKGSNMIAIEAIKKEKRLVIDGLGLDSSLISKTVMCDSVGSDMVMYIDGPTTSSKLAKVKMENLELELAPELRTLLVQSHRGIISINAASDADFDEEGKIVENKNTTYAIGELPIRAIRGRKVEDLGELGCIKLPLSKFKAGLGAASVSPYKQIAGGGIKLEVDKKANQVRMASSDGYQISLSEITVSEISNMENGDVKLILKNDIVENLIKTMDKVLSNMPKKKKSMPAATASEVKISIGKSMMEIEMPDISITTRKYQLEIDEIEAMFNEEFVWHGIINVSDVKDEVALMLEVVKGQKKDDCGMKGDLQIDLENKKLLMAISASLGGGAASTLDYAVMGDFESDFKTTQMKVPYDRLYTALGLMSDEEVLVRLHKINESVYLMSIINSVKHLEHGVSQGIVINL